MRPFHTNNSSYHGQQRAPNTFQPRALSPCYQQQGWGSGYNGGFYGNHGNPNHRHETKSQNANNMNNNGYVPHGKDNEIDRIRSCQSGKTYHDGNMGMYSSRDQYQGGNFTSKSFQNGNINRSDTAPWSNGQNYEQSPYNHNNEIIKGSYSNNSDGGYRNNYFTDRSNNRHNNSHLFNKSQSWQNHTYQTNSTSSYTGYNDRDEPHQYNKPGFNRHNPGREPGYQQQNCPQNKGGGQKKKKIDKRELPENNKFYCDTCDRGFPTEEKYTTHTNEHQKCRYEGCKYIAAPKLVQLHLRLQHANGMAKKIWSLASPEDIQKWKDERRKNFPTAENIARKNSMIEERKARGEVLETKYFGKMKGKNYKKQTIGNHDNNDNTEDLEVHDKSKNGRKRKRNRRKKFGACMNEDCEGSEAKMPKLETNNETEEPSQNNKTDLPTENGALEESRLDNKSEVQEITQGISGEACNVEKNKDGKCRSEVKNRQQQQYRKNGRKGKNQEERKKMARSHPPTLLEKLLANDIRHERNVILQCVNYIVKKNFFGMGQSTCETSTYDEQTSTKSDPSTCDGSTSTNSEPSTCNGQISTAVKTFSSHGPTPSKTEPCTSDGSTTEPSMFEEQSSSETIQTSDY